MSFFVHRCYCQLQSSYLQALPPRSGILQENRGCILPVGDAILLILGIYVTKLMPFSICGRGMMAFVSVSAFFFFFSGKF